VERRCRQASGYRDKCRASKRATYSLLRRHGTTTCKVSAGIQNDERRLPTPPDFDGYFERDAFPRKRLFRRWSSGQSALLQ
jgi:hypothetical protein